MLVPLHGPGQGVARNFFGKIIAPPAGRCWPVQSKIDELIAQNRVELTSNGTPSKKSIWTRTMETLYQIGGTILCR